MQGRPDTLITLIRGYEQKDISSNCGQILKEALKYESLARVILYDQSFWHFFTYVQGGKFDVSSDAFGTFKVIVPNQSWSLDITDIVLGSLDQA